MLSNVANVIGYQTNKLWERIIYILKQRMCGNYTRVSSFRIIEYK